MRLQALLALPLALAAGAACAEPPDRAPRTLTVELRDEPPPATEAPAASGATVLSTGRPLQADPSGNGRVLSTRPGQRPVEMLEGDPLLISMPAPQSLWFGNRSAQPGVAGVVHFDAVSDFTARIRVKGETVAIHVRPRPAGRLDAAPDAGPDPVTVYGRIGQWIALADSGTPSTGAAASGAARAGLWIRVQTAPGQAGSD
jgi:hypothetical protein